MAEKAFIVAFRKLPVHSRSVVSALVLDLEVASNYPCEVCMRLDVGVVLGKAMVHGGL